MPQKGPNTVHILEGTATLFRRPSTPHWHVRYKIHGEWLRTSTKCIALAQARKAAVDIVMQAKFREQNSLPIVNKRFKQVAKLAIARMDDLQRIGQGKSTFKTYTQALEKYFIPLIGNHNVDKIDRSVLSKFDAERLVMMGKAPSASVLNNHNSAINRVFDEALERGYMTKFQVPMLSNTGFKSERRPDFTAEEYKLLYKGMRKWVLSARSGNEGLMRRVLREYVLVLANTGMRAGTEGMNLKWSNVYFFTKDDARYLALWVDGKTKAHEMTARHAAVRYLDRLRQLNPAWASGTFDDFLKLKLDAYVFRVGDRAADAMTETFGRMFKRLLTECDLLVDGRTRKARTLYSLRHMYATYALTSDRLSIHQLAVHMDTSVGMIEKHYSHILTRNLARQIAGDAGAKKSAKPPSKRNIK